MSVVKEKKMYRNRYITMPSPHRHRCRNDASEFEADYMEHRRQFDDAPEVIGFVSAAQNRILETTGCCYGDDCLDADPDCCVLEQEGGPNSIHPSDEYFGFSPKTIRSTTYDTPQQSHFFDVDSDDDGFLSKDRNGRKMTGVELTSHKQWVDSIPDSELSMFAADNCHRRVGGNQEWHKAYVPTYKRSRFNKKNNIHNHETECCPQMHSSPQGILSNKHGSSKNKPEHLIRQETSKPRFVQSCARRGYVVDKKKAEAQTCDVWAGPKQYNCSDCRFF